MKTEHKTEWREAARITLTIHQELEKKLLPLLGSLGITRLVVENARSVRQNMTPRFWKLPGLKAELSDAPAEICRLTVEKKAANAILCRLINGLDLQTPGRGSAFIQNIVEISQNPLETGNAEIPCPGIPLLDDLSLLTAIQTKSGSGQRFYRVALTLGAGVPIVTHGIGTGIRDRLGLLRITIAPEKELTYLMVPAHDADGLQDLLIEEGDLDRPGGGFLYQTPVVTGLVDPLLRIGRQEHAASIEQIIAAIDDLKKSTAWRKRFFGIESDTKSCEKKDFSHREIVFFCHDGDSDKFVNAAMTAGAEGATVSRVRTLYLNGNEIEKSVTGEHGILCISAAQEKAVLNALCDITKEYQDPDWALQSLAVSSIFAHKRS